MQSGEFRREKSPYSPILVVNLSGFRSFGYASLPSRALPCTREEDQSEMTLAVIGSTPALAWKKDAR